MLRSLVALVFLIGLPACGLFAGRDGSTTGYYLPLTVQVRFDPTVESAGLAYKDACGQQQSLSVSKPLKDTLTKGAGLAFERVQTGDPKPGTGLSDGYLDVALGFSEVDLFVPRKGKRTYPANVTLGLDFSYTDTAGTVLFTKKLQSNYHGEIETEDNVCDLRGLDKVANEAIEKVVEGMTKQLGTAPKIRETAEARKAGAKPTAAVPPPVSPTPPPPDVIIPSITSSSAPVTTAGEGPTLSFRTILLDDNRNHVLENRETVTAEIEVKNEGPAVAREVEMLIDGSPSLARQFPGRVEIGDLQPGEIKRVKATAKPLFIKEVEQGELVLSLRSSSPGAHLPPSKKFLMALKPGEAEDVEVLSVDVDQVPKASVGFKQATAVGIVIGVGSFRDPVVPAVKYAGRDAETVAKYFSTAGGIPANRVRLLVDGQALKDDLADVFEEWLPKHADNTTIALIYFAGRAFVDAATGAVSLIPYDGSAMSQSRAFSLRRLQGALARTPMKQAVLILEVSLEPSPGADPIRTAPPLWDGQGPANHDKLMWIVGNPALQEAHPYDQGQHGLFTYFLLKGLRGAADADHNGKVLTGELCAYVKEHVHTMAKGHYGNAQEPVCIPGQGQGFSLRSLPLTKVK
ncbi:MAG: caspase family protein [Nitrospiraceae bacterium]